MVSFSFYASMLVFGLWFDQKESLRENSSVALLSLTCYFLYFIQRNISSRICWKLWRCLVLTPSLGKRGSEKQVRLSRATLEFSFGFSLWSENSFVWKLTYLHTLVQKLWSRHLPDTFQASSIHIKRGFIPLEVAVNKFWITHPVGNRR